MYGQFSTVIISIIPFSEDFNIAFSLGLVASPCENATIASLYSRSSLVMLSLAGRSPRNNT